MDKNIKIELIINAASKVHNDWCCQELEGFFERGRKVYKNSKNILMALEKACYKDGVKRNELALDISYLRLNSEYANLCFDNFEVFLKLIKQKIITIKRFAKRELSNEEIEKLGDNYIDGCENILRPFESLSFQSKRENLESAVGAVGVYIDLCRAGISIEQMKKDLNIRNLIGVAIHLDWLKRNMEHPNESLKVAYNNLDEWTKQQDLTVFDALLDIILKNMAKHVVKKVDGYSIPDYVGMEKKLLGNRYRGL